MRKHISFILLSIALCGLAACGLSKEEQEKANLRLFLAIQENSLSQVRKIVRKGAQVNAIDEKGVPALLRAIENGNRGFLIVRYLLDRGANVNCQDKAGTTPLLDALTRYRYARQKELIEILLTKGARVDIANQRGISPLFLAVRISSSLTSMFLDKGAPVNAATASGMTPLMNAAIGGSLETMRLLIKHGANVNARDKSNDTALLNAARVVSVSKIRLLLEHGADIKSQDKVGNTVIMNVIAAGYHPKLVQFLINKGANVHATNMNGDNAVKLAKDKGYWLVGHLLKKAGAVDQEKK